MANSTQYYNILSTPLRRILPPAILERLTPRQISLREKPTSQTSIVDATSPWYIRSNSGWIQYLVDRFCRSQIEYFEQNGIVIEPSKYDEHALHWQNKIDFAVNELRSRINPDNKPLEVYYFGARDDYIGVAVATNAGKLILSDIDFFSCEFPLEIPRLAKPSYEAIEQSITWLGGQVLGKEINIKAPEVLDYDDEEAKFMLDKLVEAGILELQQGEILSFDFGLNEEEKEEALVLRISDEIFLVNDGVAFNIKQSTGQNSGGYQIGMVKYGEGIAKLNCEVPLFTTTPTERTQDIIYHLCMDANTSIPDEIKDGYDVLFAKECYILNDNETKQRLYDLLRPGGKAVFLCNKWRTLEYLKTNFPMFDFSNPAIVPIPDDDSCYVIVEK